MGLERKLQSRGFIFYVLVGQQCWSCRIEPKPRDTRSKTKQSLVDFPGPRNPNKLEPKTIFLENEMIWNYRGRTPDPGWCQVRLKTRMITAELKVVIEPKFCRAAPVPSYAGNRERGTGGAWQLKLQCIVIMVDIIVAQGLGLDITPGPESGPGNFISFHFKGKLFLVLIYLDCVAPGNPPNFVWFWI